MNLQEFLAIFESNHAPKIRCICNGYKYEDLLPESVTVRKVHIDNCCGEGHYLRVTQISLITNYKDISQKNKVEVLSDFKRSNNYYPLSELEVLINREGENLVCKPVTSRMAEDKLEIEVKRQFQFTGK